jgi:hypothetical protein
MLDMQNAIAKDNSMKAFLFIVNFLFEQQSKEHELYLLLVRPDVLKD